jgi:hypothetical protein
VPIAWAHTLHSGCGHPSILDTTSNPVLITYEACLKEVTVASEGGNFLRITSLG